MSDKHPASRDLDEVRRSTPAVYEQHARAWDQNRQPLGEALWLERFAKVVPSGGTVLDLGCGTGVPIGAWLLGQGFDVTGIDYAEAMVEIARERFPQGRWRQQDMRHLELAQRFDGIVSWDGFFHLTPDEQRALLPQLHQLLKPGGALLVTVGPEAGEVTGTVEGDAVYHASLSPGEYATLLGDAGFDDVDFVANDSTCGDRSVLLAH